MPLIGNQRLLSGVLLAGVTSGLFFTVIQQIDALPLLFSAETVGHGHHPHGSAAHPSADHSLRSLARHAANIALATGFAALLSAIMLWHAERRPAQRVTAASGIGWGLAAYLALYLIPAQLYPPRTPAADLLMSHLSRDVAANQLRWLLAAAISTAALAGLLLAGRKTRLLTLATLCAGIAVWFYLDLKISSDLTLEGASRSLVLREQNYRYASYLTNLLFWLMLGGCCGQVVSRTRLNRAATDPVPEKQPGEGLDTQQ